MGGVIGVLILAMVYPFLPGGYDRLAIPVSTLVQLFGVLGMALVPVGGLWLTFELWQHNCVKHNRPAKQWRFYLAVAAMGVAWLVAAAMVVLAIAVSGLVLAVLMLVLGLYASARLIPSLRAMRGEANAGFNATPVSLILVPTAVLLAQLGIAGPMTAMSRDRAMTNSAEMIADIEAYYASYGAYPVTLVATYSDYSPGVVGVEAYQYAPDGEAYNLVFEQPRFLLDNFGAREFVVYNNRDAQVIVSHTSWILLLPPNELRYAQGWFEVNDAGRPHWKYFWFD